MLDLNIKVNHYDNSVFFIDEPETHMHTALQGKLIKEMHRIVPENGQMWITTHSLGVMRMAKKISQTVPESIVFIDFGEIDFDNEAVVTPASIDGLMWEKFLSVALDDFSEDLNPEFIIMCEGDINGKKRKDFDSYLYGKIFSNKYPNITFVSGGGSNELEQPDHVGFKLLSEILTSSKLARLIDRDDKSDEEVALLKLNGVYVTCKRHIEAYLFDDELIEKLVLQNYKADLVEDDPNSPNTDELKAQQLIKEAYKIKEEAIKNSIVRGNAPDDIKSASGEIYTGLKKLLKLTRCGNNADMFMRSTMANLLTEDTNVYKEIEQNTLKNILNNL